VKGKTNGLVVLAAFGAAVAYVMLLFVPNHKAIGALRQQIQEKRQQVVLSSTSAAAIEASKTDLARAKACIAAWDAKAPSARELSSLFGRINEAVKAAGAVNVRFEPEPVKHRERLIEIPVSIGLLGSFRQIEEFVWSLEKLPVTIWVESVKIVAPKTGEFVQGEVRLVVFTVNPENSDYAKVAGKPIN